MAVNIAYDEMGKMHIEGLECTCACEHHAPMQDIYVGTGLIDRLPEIIAARGLGKNCVLVCDQNTERVAGARVRETLLRAGYSVILCRIEREGELAPDETAAGEVLFSIQPETEFLIAVGSGTITDTTRVNAARTRLPFVSVGTAASMDGYTSVVAPLLFRGLKIHRAGPCPEIIVCDLDVLRTAPVEMARSGVGDVLGKFIAIADWRLSEIIKGEPCCPACAQIVTDAANRLLDNADEIANRTEKGIRALIEALLLAGVTIMIVGHTRAVASIEHNIEHFVDMKMRERYGRAPSHGAVVGAATMRVYPLFKRFARENPETLKPAAPPSRAAREQWMRETYGAQNAEVIMAENPGDFLSLKQRSERVERAKARFDEIRSIFEAMPPYEKIDAAMTKLGAAKTLGALGVDRDIEQTALLCGKDYRERYTLFKLLDECGRLEDYLSNRA